MKIPTRLFIAALLLGLAACGNKGPLVHPSPPGDTTTPAPASPPSGEPTDTLPTDDTTPPADTGTTTPPPPADGGGNG